MWHTDTLTNCVRALRAEIGHSLSATQGSNMVDTLKYLLGRTQYDIWLAYQFPLLRAYGGVSMQAGQADYDYPFQGGGQTAPVGQCAYDLVREAWVSTSPNGILCKIPFGIPKELIGQDGVYELTGDPPQFWDVSQLSQSKFRVAPIPITSGLYGLRFFWQLPLGPFIADNDMSTLDSTLIVLFTAAELLGRVKAEDASLKLEKAKSILGATMGNQVTAKNKVSTFATQAPTNVWRRSPYPYYPFMPTTH